MNRFLIAGCQRSGTTLMRLLLGSHSDITCIDEILSYEVLAGTRSSPATGLTGFKIPVWTEQLAEPVHLDRGSHRVPRDLDADRLRQQGPLLRRQDARPEPLRIMREYVRQRRSLPRRRLHALPPRPCGSRLREGLELLHAARLVEDRLRAGHLSNVK